MSPALPPRPSLEFLRHQARDLHRALRAQAPDALARAAPYRIGPQASRAQTQLVLAREYGFASWPALLQAVQALQAGPAAAQSDAELVERVVALALGQGWQAPRPAAALALAQSRTLREPAIWLLLGELGAVQQALQGADLNAGLPPWQAPPLVYAAASSLARLPGQQDALVRTVHWLLSQGARPDARWREPGPGTDTLPVLYGAVARAGCLPIVQALLDAGAEANDNESLYHATEQADRRILAALVQAGARWPGTNALARQLDHDDLPGLEQALALGADPNETGPGGGNSLHHAVLRGRGLAFVQRLLAAGADPARQDAHGRTAAELAASLGERELLDCLAQAGRGPAARGQAAFLQACAAGDGPAARAHLDAFPQALAGLAPSALHLLPLQAQRGRLAAVRLMLELGWPVATPGDWGGSALNQAAFRGDAAMVRLLLSHGARWHEPNDFGGTALGACLHAGTNQPDPQGDYAAVLTLLLDDGAPTPQQPQDLPPPMQAVLAARGG